MRTITALLLCFLTYASYAAPIVVDNSCTLGWDYPAAAQSSISGFRLYLDGKLQNTAAPADRKMFCMPIEKDVVHTAYVVAYNDTGESGRSNELEIILPSVTEIPVPVAPTGFHVVVTISVVPNK